MCACSGLCTLEWVGFMCCSEGRRCGRRDGRREKEEGSERGRERERERERERGLRCVPVVHIDIITTLMRHSHLF